MEFNDLAETKLRTAQRMAKIEAETAKQDWLIGLKMASMERRNRPKMNWLIPIQGPNGPLPLAKTWELEEKEEGEMNEFGCCGLVAVQFWSFLGESSNGRVGDDRLPDSPLALIRSSVDANFGPKNWSAKDSGTSEG
jgi:hypothetical protein